MSSGDQQPLRPNEALSELAAGTARDLRSLQIKITYVGSQSKPIPTVVFTTFQHLIQMEWFLSLRTRDLHYGNDDVSVWNFTVTPDEIKTIVTTLSANPGPLDAREVSKPLVSLMFALRDSRLGAIAFEAVLNRDNAEQIIRTIGKALDETNGLARNVVDLQSQAIFT